jgi:hypothetical protein
MAKAKKKTPPVDIKITGAQQVAAIKAVYAAKTEADEAKRTYDDSRKGALGTLISKIFAHWTKRGAVSTGAYAFNLPDGSIKVANAQNRQSTKSYDPADAKELLMRLNANTEPGAKFKAGDVYNVKVDHGLSPEAMKIKGVRERILTVLTQLEAEMKSERALPPEVSLIQEDKTLVLADHALDRILAMSTNFDDAMEVLGNPVSVNLVTK